MNSAVSKQSELKSIEILLLLLLFGIPDRKTIKIRHGLNTKMKNICLRNKIRENCNEIIIFCTLFNKTREFRKASDL